MLAQHGERGAALLYLDLDGMKQINDIRGHAAGDATLVRTAEALRSAFRATDLLARLGGDEVVVLAIDHQGDGAAVRARLVEELDARQLQASIGMTLYESSAPPDLDALMSVVDARMYAIKQARRRTR